MADDPRFQWQLTNPYGILFDEKADSWWSSHDITMVHSMDRLARNVAISYRL